MSSFLRRAWLSVQAISIASPARAARAFAVMSAALERESITRSQASSAASQCASVDNSRLITYPLGIYIHALGGTPFLIHLYFVYFMLPATGVAWLQFEAYAAAIIALSLYTSTYVAEIIRGAIEAVPRGQSEAARATGMTALEAMWYVVLPQAVKMMIPPWVEFM